MQRYSKRGEKLTLLMQICKYQFLEGPKFSNRDFSDLTKKGGPHLRQWLQWTLYLWKKPSKVVGRVGHIDFFCLDWKSHFGKFWREKFFDFQNFFSWELALVYTMLIHIKLIFHHSNPWSQTALCQGGQNHCFQA